MGDRIGRRLNCQRCPPGREYAGGAFNRWKAKPEHVKILDVRTPEEFVFVGHAEMAMNIPLDLASYRWEADEIGGSKCVIEPNSEFVAQVKEWANPLTRHW